MLVFYCHEMELIELLTTSDRSYLPIFTELAISFSSTDPNCIESCSFLMLIFTPPYGRTSRVWDSLLVMKSGCAGGRGFAPRPGK